MSKNASFRDVINVPVPDKTETYTPVPNRDVLKLTKKIAGDYNYELNPDQQVYRLGNSNNIMVARLTFNPTNDSGLRHMIAIMNSYDKSRSLRIGSGAQVFVCMNGMLRSDLVRMRKHTGELQSDVESMIVDSVEKLDKEMTQLKEDTEVMKEFKITDLDSYHIIGELFMKDEIIKPRQLTALKRNMFIDNNFSMEKPEDKTLWNLYNNVTEVLKKSNPNEVLTNHIDLHKKFASIPRVGIEGESDFETATIPEVTDNAMDGQESETERDSI